MRSFTILTLLCFISFGNAFAEPVFNTLALKQTDFKITFDNSTAQVLSQGITQRAVIDSITNKDGSETTIAYQAYHLEITFQQRFSNQREYASVEFYNVNTVIHVMSMTDPSRKLTTTRNRLRESNYLAINLEGTPLIMLNDVTRINFVR
jgi:hypothetical protein